MATPAGDFESSEVQIDERLERNGEVHSSTETLWLAAAVGLVRLQTESMQMELEAYETGG